MGGGRGEEKGERGGGGGGAIGKTGHLCLINFSFPRHGNTDMVGGAAADCLRFSYY